MLLQRFAKSRTREEKSSTWRGKRTGKGEGKSMAREFKDAVGVKMEKGKITINVVRGGSYER